MNVSSQFHVPLLIPTSEQKTKDGNTSSISVNTGTLIRDPDVVSNYRQGEGHARYPDASPDEILNLNTLRSRGGAGKSRGTGGSGGTGKSGGAGGSSGTGKSGGAGGSGGTGGSSGTGKSGGASGSGGAGKSGGGSNGINRASGSSNIHKPSGSSSSPSNAANNQQGIIQLSNNGSLPPAAKGVGAQIRDNFISTAVAGLVGSGISVAQHAVSEPWKKKVEDQANMPGAEKKNPDGTITTVDPDATKQQKFDASLKGAELNTVTLVNSITVANEGPDAPAVDISANAPTDNIKRLENLEKLLDAAEGPLAAIADRNDVVYRKLPAEDTSTSSPERRLEHIKARYEKMNKMFVTLERLKSEG